MEVFLGSCLDQWFKSKAVHQVIEVEESKASKGGDNYLSEVKRYAIKCQMTSGRVKVVKCIAKFAPTTPAKRKLVNVLSLFGKEIKVYRDVLQHMAELFESLGDGGGPMWPEAIHIHYPDTVILQDLTQLGYKMQDRRVGLDFDHTLLAIQGLARYHAASVVLLDRFLIEPAFFSDFVYTNNHPFVQGAISADLVSLTNAMKGWSAKWRPLRDYLESLAPRIIQIMGSLCKFNPAGFNVLCHGDPWTNNILYKYCPFTGKLVDVKFIDFQMSHFNSFAIDLQYLLNTSTLASVRDKQYDTLLKAYHVELTKTFEKLQHRPEKLPTLDDVKAEMKAKELWGVLAGSCLCVVMAVDPESAMDLEDLLNSEDKETTALPTVSTHAAERAKGILRPFINKKSFQEWTSVVGGP